MRSVGLAVCLATLLVIAVPTRAESVWKWRDENGVTHYSDQPSPGAERVQLRSRDNAPATAPASQDAKTRNRSSEPTAPTYRNLEIWKPSAEETIAGSGGEVGVGIRVEPALAPGHTLWLYLDGRRVDSSTPNSTEYDLQEVNRGQHTLTAVIANSTGKQVLSSKPVTFTVNRPSNIKPAP